MLGHHGISDPGEVVVKAAIENNIEIIPIPGACAAINALISSGMKTNEFIFIGFLPVNIKEKKEKLAEIKKYTQTIILYEAPHKLINTLKMMLEEIGELVKSDKRWKNFRNNKFDRDNKLEELCDCFITLMNITMFSGFSCEEVEEAVANKIDENYERCFGNDHNC